MATTSEIQVTEAYIGLLGRAPDPAGLAYWAKQLDDAIAAGEDAAVALKKLTNDITLSAEWDAGIGAQDASTQSGADSIVASMYTNLFGRAATTADKAYWSAELVAGTTTASEMAVQLIQSAGTTDGATLGYKQEAATYYVETVAQADFNKTNAASAVSSVDSPLSLASSKEATDALATGTGITVALTTGDDSGSLTMTLGDDSVTGTVGVGATYQNATDSVVDASTADSDSFTLSGDDSFTFGTVTNVEAVNLNLGKQVGGNFNLQGINNVTGSSVINIDVADKVTIAGVEVTGETDVTLTGGLAADVTTTDVTSIQGALATGAAESDLTITGDADLATVTLTSIADNDTSLVLGDNDSTVSLDGTAATNDSASISTSGKSAVSLSAGNPVDELTLSGSGAAVTYTITNAAAAATKFTTTGDQAVTLSGTSAMFHSQTFTQSGTGALGLVVTGTPDTMNVWNAGKLAGGISLAGDQGNAIDTYTIASGTAVSFDAAQTNTAEHIFDANDAATDSTITVNANFNTGELAFVDYETISIATNDSAAIVIDEIDSSTNDATVAIVGANDITITGNTIVDGDTTISGKKLAAAVITANSTNDSVSADVSLTASDDIAVTGKITAQNDITITATNDITIVNSDATTGAMTVTGDDFEATGLVDAQNDISITVTNDVDLDAVTSSNGSVSIKGATIDNQSAIISAPTGEVTLTATNDAATSDIDFGVTAVKVTLADGKFDAAGDNAKITAPTIVISGDTDVTASVMKTDSVAITSTNDVTISAIDETTAGEGFVIAGASATGKITVVTDSDATNAGNATIYTGSGADNVTLNDANTTFVVSTGGNTGTETITATLFETGSVINSGDGNDLIDINDTNAGILTVDAGDGDDTVDLVSTNVTGTFDLGAGTGDKVLLSGGAQAYTTATIFKNIEYLDMAADSTFTWASLSNDATFELSGVGKTLIVNGADNVADTIDLSGVTANALDTADVQAAGGSGNDVITGSVDMINVLDGGAGLDTITGGNGGDTITGGADNDTITGGEGTDAINGEAGFDSIILTESASVADTVTVGADMDTLTNWTQGTDKLVIDLSDAATTVSGTALTDVHSGVLGAGAMGVITNVAAGGQDLEATASHALYIEGTFASTDAVETALEVGGSNVLTTGAAGKALQANDTFLVIYDDGTNTYIAGVTTDENAADTQFTAGSLTVEILVTLSGVANGDLIVAGDFGAHVT